MVKEIEKIGDRVKTTKKLVVFLVKQCKLNWNMENDEKTGSIFIIFIDNLNYKRNASLFTDRENNY